MTFAAHHSQARHARTHIRRLWPSDVAAYREHLLRLDDEGRYSRFGAVMTETVLAEHANACFGVDTLVFAYVCDGMIRGAAELHVLDSAVPAPIREAEAAFSVEKRWRHTGLGSALVDRLLLAACNRGLRSLVISCLPQNIAMQKLAKKFGARLKFETDEVMGKITVRLPTPQTMLTEFVEESLDFATAVVALQKRIFQPPLPAGRAA